MTESTYSDHQCIILFGGSFDPVHAGHVALATTFVHLLKPTQLRLIPTGLTSHKTRCVASPQDRIAMLSLAFTELAETTSIFIDSQEINRAQLNLPSYTVDTLTLIREEVGPATSLIFLIGADQLQQLHRWKNWRNLIHLAHIGAAARPGFTLDSVDPLVASEFKQHASTLEKCRTQPYGGTYLLTGLSVDISSSQIRHGDNLSYVPAAVLNYIQQHHLYQKTYGH